MRIASHRLIHALAGVLVAMAGLAALPANAALVQCFNSNSMIEDTAVCRSYGVLEAGEGTPDTQDAGVAATVDGGIGALVLASYAGTSPVNASGVESLGTVGTPIQFSNNIIAADYYLVLVWETGAAPRDWLVINVLGSELIAGLDYAESVPTGTVKFRIFTDPTNGGGGGNVPEPGTLALMGLGLVAASLARRRRR